MTSSSSNTPVEVDVENASLPTFEFVRTRGDALKRILSGATIHNVADLRNVLCQLAPKHSRVHAVELGALQDAVARTPDFFQVIVPNVCKWALECDSIELELLPAHRSAQMECDRRTARALLAHAFLDNVNVANLGEERQHFGDLAWDKCMTRGYIPVAAERLCALFCYFRLAAADDESGAGNNVVRVRRLADRSTVDWAAVHDAKIDASRVAVHRGLMEAPYLEKAAVAAGGASSDAASGTLPAFFDFANRDLQIHTNIPSCTQEEILFSMCPECFVAMAVVERLNDTEVASIHGVRRFALYTGYLDSTRVVGHNPDYCEPFDVVAADACTGAHRHELMVQRDLHKMLLVFRSAPSRALSSGAWGSGAFGGSPAHGFMKQLLPAALTGAKLIYSAREKERFDTACQLLAACDGRSVADVYDIMMRYSRAETMDEPFEKFFLRTVNGGGGATGLLDRVGKWLF